ncbi:MAG: nucleotide exchange factor GrpE [Anaerolineae bacterium]|nr:nucleotide exchange factor GrpE [Anaerolineae bacterium]
MSPNDKVENNNEPVFEDIDPSEPNGTAADIYGDDVNEAADMPALDAMAEPEAAEGESDDVMLDVQLEQAENRAQEYLDGLQRERASFQNYKKRVERERAELRRVVSGTLLLKLLPVLDDFERAMSAIPEEERSEWFDGITLIQRKFERFLDDEGIKRIKALGETFDPNFHEAIGVDNDTDAETDTITEVLQPGYLYGDVVLRPARVRVAG